MGLQWSDVDFDKKVVYVRRSLCYFRKDGKYIFEWHDAKTHNSKRTISLTTRVIGALKKQPTYTAVYRTRMYGCNNETNSERTPGI